MTDFPSTPTLGDLHTYAGIRYRWNGSKWIIQTGTTTPKLVTASGGAIDLSKGTYHKLSTNIGKNISFSNIPAGSSKWSLELDINTTSKYDITNASLTGVNLYLGGEDAAPYQIWFSPDGTRFFFVGTGSDKVYSYSLSTPWNVSTASLVTSLDTASYDATMTSIAFDPSGRFMYLGGTATTKIYQFELATNWDITTGTLLSSITIDPGYTNPFNIKFNADGTRIYALSYRSAGAIFIFQHDLSTAWDISTASNRAGVGIAAQDSGMYSFDFNGDGTKLFALGFTADRIYQYTLSTPWAINTASYDNMSFLTSSEANPFSLFFKPDGTKMWVSGYGSDTVREYTTTSNSVIYSGGFTFPDNVIWAQGTPPITSENDTKVLDFYSPDGGTTIYGKERYTTNAVVKAGKLIPISLRLYVSAVNTWTYHEYTSRIQQYAGRSARLLFQQYGPSMQNGEGWICAIDLLNFNNTTYSFENATQGWVTTGQNVPVGGTPFPTSTWTTPLIGTGGVSGNFAMSTAVGGAPGGGSYSAYGYGAPYVHASAYLRSPTVTLTSNPSLSFYLRKDGLRTVTSAYLEILD